MARRGVLEEWKMGKRKKKERWVAAFEFKFEFNQQRSRECRNLNFLRFISECEIVNIGITMKREASRKSRRFKEPRGVLYYEVAI